VVDFKKKLALLMKKRQAKTAKSVRVAKSKQKKPTKPIKRTSLAPKPKRKPVQADPVLPSIDDAITRTSTRNMTQSLIENYRGIQVQIKELTQSKAEVGEEIVEILKNWKLKGVRYGRLTAAREQGVKRTLSPIKLIENGVSPLVIKKSTTETKYEKFVVRGSNEQDGSGGGESGEEE
jgi:hypothetical protein